MPLSTAILHAVLVRDLSTFKVPRHGKICICMKNTSHDVIKGCKLPEGTYTLDVKFVNSVLVDTIGKALILTGIHESVQGQALTLV